MYFILLIFIVSPFYTVQGLEPFDPWNSSNNLCKPSMESCTFYLEAASAMTMFYKQLFRVVATDDGILHKYDDENKIFDARHILTGDGYPKLVYVFNNSLPGPVLNVYKGQKIFVRILNHLATESLSVHFHGIRQVGTVASDGVGYVTQLLILPGSSFLHEFTAVDEGTFWYHSHAKSQTSMGLVGAFIVHPNVIPTKANKEFTLILQDWQHIFTGEQHQFLVQSGQFFPNSIESIMSSGTFDYYQAVDGSRSAEALVTSILVNGRGQYFDPRTNERSSTPFERLIVDPLNSQYLIRLINGGSTFSMVFSIDEHKLQVISSDGVPFSKPMLVDKIILGLGERYDLLVNVSATPTRSSWWIHADTMDKNNNTRWHGRAILQIGNDTLMKPTSDTRSCSSQEPCYILNCPFTQYGSQSNIICLTLQNITTDSAHIDEDLVSDNINITIKRALSLTIVEPTEEESGFESINYLSMAYPSIDQPIINMPKAAREQRRCLNISDRIEANLGQKCYNHVVAEFGDIIEFLIVNFDGDQHPLHLHGSYFHIVEQGFSQLNKTTGLFIANNPNVKCDDDDINCECVNCKTNMRLVKDTIIVPRGGYMRIRFRTTNPGVWLFHCHTEPHLDRGMAIMIHIAEDRLVTLVSSTDTIKKTNNRRQLILSVLLISVINKITL